MTVSDHDSYCSCLEGFLNIIFRNMQQVLIWFGTRANHAKLSADDLDLQVGVDTIHPATSIRYLGIRVDPKLTMSNHVSNVAIICFFQVRRLRHVS